MVITKQAWLTKLGWLKEFIQKAQKVFNFHSANLLSVYKTGATGTGMMEESGMEPWH